MTTMSSTHIAPDELSTVVISLLRGPIYQDSDPKTWASLLRVRARVADYVGVLGLRVEIDETDGYAYVRSTRTDEVDVEYPRLVTRHRLSFHVSLLVALLRKRLAEFDSSSSDERLVLTTNEIVDLMRTYLPDSTDEIRMRKDIGSHIAKVVDLGFLSKLRGDDDAFEVRRIIRAFVDGQWLSDFDERLKEYVESINGASQ